MQSISISGLSKSYRLGLTHQGSIRELANDISRRFLFFRKKPEEAKVTAEKAMFWALKDINFEIAQGEAVGIIGKNGAGKSTLLKILSRITKPTLGRAKLRGRVASLLEVGTGFHQELTGRENVYLNGTILGMRRREIRDKLDSIVEFSGVERFLDTPVKRYSSGMMVRLGFAVAAHLDPEILIVDEVLAVGDIEFQNRCIGKMQSVSESGKTVLFVSHNLASIRNLTTRTIVLSEGSVAFDGTTEEAINRYIVLNAPHGKASLPVSDMPRPFSGLSRDLSIVDLQINYQAQPNSSSEQSHLSITAKVQSVRFKGDFIFSMTIYTEDHSPIGSTFSPILQAPQPGDFKSYAFSALFPLAPGRYHCAVSLANSRYQLQDSLSEVLPFEIPLSAMGERQWASGWGPIRLSALQYDA